VGAATRDACDTPTPAPPAPAPASGPARSAHSALPSCQRSDGSPPAGVPLACPWSCPCPRPWPWAAAARPATGAPLLLDPREPGRKAPSLPRELAPGLWRWKCCRGPLGILIPMFVLPMPAPAGLGPCLGAMQGSELWYTNGTPSAPPTVLGLPLVLAL